MFKRTLQRGTTEYLDVLVRSDVDLGNQTVEVSFNKTDWFPAEWTGTAGLERKVQVLVDDSRLPANVNQATVYIRVTDEPEIPILAAGAVQII